MRPLIAPDPRRQPEAVAADLDLDPVVGEDRDMGALGAVGGDDAAAVGGDAQPPEAAVGLADGEDAAVRGVGASRPCRRARSAASPSAWHSIRLSGSPAAGGALPAGRRAAAGGEEKETKRGGACAFLSFPPQRFEPARHLVAADQRVEARVHAPDRCGRPRRRARSPASARRGFRRRWRGSPRSSRARSSVGEADPQRLGAVDRRGGEQQPRRLARPDQGDQPVHVLLRIGDADLRRGDREAGAGARDPRSQAMASATPAP